MLFKPTGSVNKKNKNKSDTFLFLFFLFNSSLCFFSLFWFLLFSLYFLYIFSALLPLSLHHSLVFSFHLFLLMPRLIFPPSCLPFFQYFSSFTFCHTSSTLWQLSDQISSSWVPWQNHEGHIERNMNRWWCWTWHWMECPPTYFKDLIFVFFCLFNHIQVTWMHICRGWQKKILHSLYDELPQFNVI